MKTQSTPLANAPALFGMALLAIVLGLALASCDEEPIQGQQQQQVGAIGSRVVLPNVARDGPNGTFQYTVQPGETLFSIAQRFGTTVQAIVALNPIADQNNIRAGQVLIIPQAAPTATPTATPTRTTVPSGPSQLVYNGPRNSGHVALTFDMGGRVEPAVDIMNFLVDNNVRATIFMTGQIMDTSNTDAGRRVLDIIEAHPELFEVGNHSYNHPRFTEISATQIRQELADTETAFARWSVLNPRPLFRPPEGAVNSSVLSVVGPAGYSHTIMWDVDTIDWRPVDQGGPTTQAIVTKVLNNATGGSIVLMHLGGYNTLAALPQIVAGLRSEGYELVRVGEMLDLR